MRQDKFHQLYDALISKDVYQFYSSLVSSIDADDIIIDAGCGSGELSRMLSSFAKKVYAFDIDESSIHQAKLKTNQVTFVTHDMHNPWPFYGSIVCMSQDVINFSNNPYQVLKHAMDAIMNEGVIIFDMYVDVNDYEEKGMYPMSYHWKRTVESSIIFHEITIDDEIYTFKQYIHALEDVTSWIKNQGYHVEIKNYINKEKIVLIASR